MSFSPLPLDSALETPTIEKLPSGGADEPTNELEFHTVDLEPHASPAAEAFPDEVQPSAAAASGAYFAANAANPEPVDPFAFGQVLRERYYIEDILGTGGSAIVYRARDLHWESADGGCAHVAIKTLRPELRHRPQSIARLKREFRQTRLLTHPNIVRVFDLDCHDDAWFIVMELLEGTSLSGQLRAAPLLPAQRIEKILMECGAALQFAHERNVVHGDLKPGNVFLLDTGEIRLLDFGASPDSTGQSGTCPIPPAVTPAYASPEVLASETPETRDDVYSLACIAQQLISGQHPTDRLETPGNQPTRHEEATLALTLDQRGILNSGLAAKRKDRPSTVAALLAFLSPPESALSAAAEEEVQPPETMIEAAPADIVQADQEARKDELSTLAFLHDSEPAAAATFESPVVEASSPSPAVASEDNEAVSQELAASEWLVSVPTALHTAAVASEAFTEIKTFEPTAQPPTPPIARIGLTEPENTAPAPSFAITEQRLLGAEYFDEVEPAPKPLTVPGWSGFLNNIFVPLTLRWAAAGVLVILGALAIGILGSHPQRPANTSAEKPSAAIPTLPAATPPEPLLSNTLTPSQSALLGVNAPPPTTQPVAVDDPPKRADNLSPAVAQFKQEVAFDVASVAVSARASAAVLTLKRSNGRDGRVRVSWRLNDGTAKAGRDFTGPTSGVVEMAHWQTVKSLYIPLIAAPGDVTPRNFTIKLTGASGARIAPNDKVTITIKDFG